MSRVRRKRSELTVHDTLKLSDAVQEFLLTADGKRLSSRTIDWYRQKLSHFETWMLEREHISVKDLSTHLLRAYLADVSVNGTGLSNPRQGVVGDLSGHTVKGYYQVLKSFLRFLYQDGLIKTPMYDFLKTPHVEQGVIKVFSAAQLKALLTVARKTDLPYRDVAILSTLIDTGIRAGELVTLTLPNLSLSQGDGWVRVTGKGRKERTVPLGPDARLAIYRYLAREREQSERLEVFLSYGGRPMSPGGLHSLVARLGEDAHVTGVRCSPHTFRHTFAVRYKQSGGDVYNLSRLLGHSSVKVTEIYLGDFHLENTVPDRRTILGEVLRGESRDGKGRLGR